MNKVILFDIDGTLVKSIPGNTHALAFVESIKNLYGINVELDWANMAGLTDQVIPSRLLESAGWSKDEIAAEMPKVIAELENIYLSNFEKGSVELCPGVQDLLHTLQEQNFTLGLLTGNLQPIAKIKLEDAGIYQYFSLGGFGSDEHLVRSELVTVAAERAGLTNDLSKIYLVGDTPRDIEAANQAGVYNTIGVATGHSSIQSLQDAGAGLTLNTLEEQDRFLDFVN